MLSSLHRRVDEYLFRDDGHGTAFTSLHQGPQRRSAASSRSHLQSGARNVWLLINCSWTNLLLPFTLLALSVGQPDLGSSSLLPFIPTSPAFVFWTNYFAILSVIGLFRYSSESLSMAARPPVRHAWNMTIGAFSLDLEVALVALLYDELNLVKAYIVGKIVSTLLLTLGASFVASGLLRPGSLYNANVARTLSVLLATAMFPFAILAVYPQASQPSEPALVISRGSSFVLLFLYSAYQHHQHAHVVYYKSDSTPSTPTTGSESGNEEVSLASRSSHHPHPIGPVAAISTMTITAAIAWHCTIPLLHAITAESSTSSPEDFTRALPSSSFFGFCLLPLLAELGEITKIIRLAVQDHIDIVLEVATEVCAQTVLFNAPLLCLLGWALDRKMSLSLDLLEVVCFASSVWVFNYVVRKGSSDYMHGFMSIGLYIVQVLAFFLGRWSP